MRDKIWNRGDVVAGGLTGLLAFAVYAWTAAPNVTLLDSGEFIVAAQHFGVPHPTGYPLWTLLAWIFQLLPLGNAAWEINIFSAFCGGLAVALTTALTRSSLRWLMEDRLAPWRGLGTIISVTGGLLFAFSFSMWSQATIAEVYTLHALLIGAYLAVIYIWLRRPDRLGILLFAFFLLTLSFSNHHLSIAMAPIPFLAVLLVRREIFWDLLLASLLTALLGYLGFSILSAEPPILRTAIRFFYVVMLGLVVLVVVRRLRLEWRLVAYLPFVVALGLIPYAYMPFASSTNPPMNWAYTRTPEGFYFSFNRSQYGGSLSQQSMRSLGRLMGTAGGSAPQAAAGEELPEASLTSRLNDWTGFFWLQLGRSFTPIGILGYFAALLVIFRLTDVARRTWVYLLEFAFLLAAILQPIADGAGIDVNGWWLQMPYHTYTNLIFALLAALGLAYGMAFILARYPRLAWSRFLLLALPLMPLYLNEAGCSQRGRWFGWEFGHDMLNDLPKGSVVFGGTDPGRFVPTYMILGESSQDPSVKRDPGFDRRDLYIITQNGVGEKLYRNYLADQYGPSRPGPKNAFERWLGRQDAYPKTPLVFPTEEEINAAIKKEVEEQMKDGGSPDPAVAHSVVTRLIWEKNRDAHEFFVEESFPLHWSYDHALPSGLTYRILKDPIKELPADAVKKDMEFWNRYVKRLIGDPNFAKDYDAQRSFSKLRTTTANLYKHRKMDKEAEVALRQSLLLWPGNPESLTTLTGMLWDRGDFEGAIEVVQSANAQDMNNLGLWRIRAYAEKRKELDGEIQAARQGLEKNPKDLEKTKKLLELYFTTGDTNRTSELLKTAIETFQADPEFLTHAIQVSGLNSLPDREFEAAKRLATVSTNVESARVFLARALFKNNDKTNFYPAARAAIEAGGLPVQEAFFGEPLYAPWREEAEFQKLKDAPRLPGAAAAKPDK